MAIFGGKTVLRNKIIISILLIFVIFFAGCSAYPRFYSRRMKGDLMLYQIGVASYYADEFHGKKTSCGEVFDMNELTAAHRTLPFQTNVKVTNYLNGESVIVRINDRGPFVKGRIIDLSKSAAKEINMISTGTAPVKLEIQE
ncbi:MAG: septal ring lytic transglycosylase RlpA family protein [Candidatus Zixiibacteriota bacterium]